MTCCIVDFQTKRRRRRFCYLFYDLFYRNQGNSSKYVLFSICTPPPLAGNSFSLFNNIHRTSSNRCLNQKCCRRHDFLTHHGWGWGGTNYVYKPYSNFLEMTHTNVFCSIRKTTYQTLISTKNKIKN